MRKRRMFWGALILSCAALTATGQITIHASDFPMTGTYTIGQYDYNAPFNVGSAGENQTWTFVNYPWFYVQQHELVDPASTPYGVNFPTANRAQHTWINVSPANDVYAYESIVDNGFYALGSASNSSQTVFDVPMLNWPLSLDYQAQWTSIRRYHYGIPFGIISVTDSILVSADGWGTLNTPFGSYTVLRLFSRVWHTEQTDTFPPTTTRQLAYNWIDQRGFSVVQVSSYDGVTDPNFNVGIVFMRDVPLAVDSSRNSIASAIALAQNYPNPFNAATEIEYALPRAQTVSLKVFDMLGREIQTLVSGMQPVGTHRVNFDGRALPSGMYLYRLETGGSTQTRRMMLLK